MDPAPGPRTEPLFQCVLAERERLAEMKRRAGRHRGFDKALQEALGDEDKLAKLKDDVDAAVGGDDGES